MNINLAPVTEDVKNLGDIDSHLAHLYHVASGGDALRGIPVVTTTLQNLIIYAANQQQADQAMSDASEVMGTHPSRVIILEAALPEEREETASVSAICGITDRGDRRLCGDIIRIHIAGLEEEVAGSVMPILMPDIPVFLWMIDEVPCGRQDIRAIVDMADHFIIDSRRFGDLRGQLMVVSGMCFDADYTKTVQDLSWIQLRVWRDLAAQHFDTSRARPFLDKLMKVTIRYQKAENSDTLPSAPLLFASWFIERTGIEIIGVEQNAGECLIKTKQNGRNVEVCLVAESDGPGSGWLSSVSIQAGDENGTASFVTKSTSTKEISVSDECAGVCYLPMMLELSPQSEAALVSQALDTQGNHSIYADALRVALSIIEGLG